MKALKKRYVFISTGLIWLVAMGILIHREYFPSQEEITTNYREILQGIREKKTSSMAIYYIPFNLKIGKIQTSITPQTDGTFDIDTRTNLSFTVSNYLLLQQIQQLLNIPKIKGKTFRATFFSNAHIGPDYELKEISFRFTSNFLQLSYEGRVKSGKLFLALTTKGKKIIHEMALPSGTVMGDAVGLLGKFPKLRVGRRFSMRWFDPITHSYRTVHCTVKEKKKCHWQGKEVVVYHLESKLGELTSFAWITEEGEILQYRILSFLLTRDDQK